jgi:hypothetical protein
MSAFVKKFTTCKSLQCRSECSRRQGSSQVESADLIEIANQYRHSIQHIRQNSLEASSHSTHLRHSLLGVAIRAEVEEE